MSMSTEGDRALTHKGGRARLSWDFPGLPNRLAEQRSFPIRAAGGGYAVVAPKKGPLTPSPGIA